MKLQVSEGYVPISVANTSNVVLLFTSTTSKFWEIESQHFLFFKSIFFLDQICMLLEFLPSLRVKIPQVAPGGALGAERFPGSLIVEVPKKRVTGTISKATGNVHFNLFSIIFRTIELIFNECTLSIYTYHIIYIYTQIDRAYRH